MRIKYRAYPKIILLLAVSFLFSCKEDRFKTNEENFSIRDDLGNVLTFDTIPKRIISLAPNITEGLFAIGAGDQIVGVTKFCDYPAEARSKTNTGGLLDPNYEIMTSLDPDLVIMTVEGNSQPSYQALEKLGMKIFVSNPRNVDGIFKMIDDLGKLTGKEENADNLVRSLTKEKEKLLEDLKTKEQKNSLLLISVNPLMTANGNTFINDILDLSGLNNIYKEETLDYPSINTEDALGKNPEVIILPADTSNTARTDQMKAEITKELKNTDAVKDGNIVIIDANLAFRPGPRVLEAVIMLKKKLSYQ